MGTSSIHSWPSACCGLKKFSFTDFRSLFEVFHLLFHVVPIQQLVACPFTDKSDLEQQRLVTQIWTTNLSFDFSCFVYARPHRARKAKNNWPIRRRVKLAPVVELECWLSYLNSSVQSRSEWKRFQFNSWLKNSNFSIRFTAFYHPKSYFTLADNLQIEFTLCEFSPHPRKLALLRILRKWFFALKAPFLKVTWFLSAWLVALSGNARSSWIWWWWMVGILDYHNFLSHRHRSGFHPKFYFMLCSLVFLDLSLQSEHENETQRCKGSFSSPQIAKSIFPQGQMFAVYWRSYPLLVRCVVPDNGTLS